MYLLFDVGGTKMRLAISRDGETIDEPEIISTPASFVEAFDLLKKVANRLCGEGKIEAVAGGLAGTFDHGNSVLLGAPHLAEWINQPISDLFKKEFNCPVYLENDTALVGLGEATAGAGQGGEIVAYITVSTGVGGARIVDGKIDRHLTSFEPGHQLIDLNEPHKHLEDYVSGSAVRRETGEDPQDITDPEYWNKLARILAVGLHNTILHWTPDVLVLGGSMMKEPGIKLGEVETHLSKSLAFLPVQPTLKLASLGDLGGLHGALAYLKQQL